MNTPSPFLSRTALHLRDASTYGKIMVEGEAAAQMLHTAWAMPDLEVGTGAEIGPGQVYRLRSDLFFVHTPPGVQSETTAFLGAQAQQAAGLVTVTDVTHGRVELRLAGPDAPDLLTRLCALDFGPAAFPHLAARYTSLAKTRQLLLRRDEDGVPAYAIIGGRSLGGYLLATVVAAGHDLGIQTGAGAGA